MTDTDKALEALKRECREKWPHLKSEEYWDLGDAIIDHLASRALQDKTEALEALEIIGSNYKSLVGPDVWDGCQGKQALETLRAYIQGE